jgi:FkbM family methyltransferase
MEQLGHDRIDLLKIDIEGAEYKVIESILADKLDIRVICVEYDECFNPIDDRF